MRLEAQICAAFPQIASPSFPNREAMLKAIASTATTATSTAGAVLSVEDIVVLLSDIKVVSLWMQNQLNSNISLSFQVGYSGFKHIRDVDISSEISSNSSKALASQSRKYQLISDAIWSRALALLSAECKIALQQVKGVAGKYRMTNKPPPDSASPFVAVILKPVKYVLLSLLSLFYLVILNQCALYCCVFREFLQKHIGDVTFLISTSAASAATSAGQWQAEIVEDVTVVYVQQVQALIETAKQMDSALMRRAKSSSATSAGSGGAAGMTDSEKIALQMILDIGAFEAEVRAVGIRDPRSLPACASLYALIDDMKRSFENLPQS
jgi:hypothetical protein